jgi:hypothetical protein
MILWVLQYFLSAISESIQTIKKTVSFYIYQLINKLH